MIRIYSLCANRPEFIEWQQRTFSRFLSEDHRLIIINNGHGEVRDRIGLAARALGLQCHDVVNPRHDLAGEGHIRSFEFTRDKFLAGDNDLSIVLDGDMFLCKPFNLREWLGGAMLAGLAQAHGHVRHFFSGLIFMDLDLLPDLGQFSIGGGVVDGQGCDVGGQSYYYLRDHPQVPVKWIEYSGQIMNKMNNLDALPSAARDSYRDGYAVEILAGAWLHHREGSKWNHEQPDYYADKFTWMCGLLRDCMEGKVVMP